MYHIYPKKDITISKSKDEQFDWLEKSKYFAYVLREDETYELLFL